MPIIVDLIESLNKIAEIHKKKNDDYASSDNPFSNFDVSEYLLAQFKDPRDQAFVWPIATKLARLSTLLNKIHVADINGMDKPEINNESIEDSFIDIATYVLLWKADIKRRLGKI